MGCAYTATEVPRPAERRGCQPRDELAGYS